MKVKFIIIYNWILIIVWESDSEQIDWITSIKCQGYIYNILYLTLKHDQCIIKSNLTENNKKRGIGLWEWYWKKLMNYLLPIRFHTFKTNYSTTIQYNTQFNSIICSNLSKCLHYRHFGICVTRVTLICLIFI